MSSWRNTAVFLALAAPIFAASPDAVPRHPRMILTPQRITSLRQSLDTTRAGQWRHALLGAEEFAAAPIPQMTQAHNQFRYIGETMPSLGLAYWMTGDERYVRAAEKWLRAVIAVKQWSGSQNLGRSAWMTGSALLYDWLRDKLDPELRAAVRERLEREGGILMKDAAYWRLLSNHCLIETSALGLAGLALEGESQAAPSFIAKARERTALIIEHAPLDGAWSEGVQYWEYGLSYFLRYLEALKTAGTADYYPGYDWLRKTGYFRIYFSLPGAPAESVNFSDCCQSGGEQRWRASFLLHQLAAVYRDRYLQDFAGRLVNDKPYKFSWLDFIIYDPAVAQADFHQLPAEKYFEDSGFAMLRSSWRDDATMVAFRCGPAPGHRNQKHPLRLDRKGFGPGHQHPDINSFSIFAYGKWLAIDPGYVHRKTTAEHNTILVNGQGQVGAGSEWLDFMAFENREPQPSILRAEIKPEYDYVIGDAGNIYVDEAGLASFRRHLLFLKPDVIVIADDLIAHAPSRFDWLIHALNPVTRADSHTFEIREQGVRLWVKPLLPQTYEAHTSEEPYSASNLNGKLSTLRLESRGAAQTRYLVVLAALEDAAAAAPEVSFAGDRLIVRHKGRSWNVQVIAPASLRSAADPVFRLDSPGRP